MAHCLLVQFSLKKLKDGGEPGKQIGKISFIDLAGSERGAGDHPCVMMFIMLTSYMQTVMDGIRVYDVHIWKPLTSSTYSLNPGCHEACRFSYLKPLSRLQVQICQEHLCCVVLQTRMTMTGKPG